MSELPRADGSRRPGASSFRSAARRQFGRLAAGLYAAVISLGAAYGSLPLLETPHPLDEADRFTLSRQDRRAWQQLKRQLIEPGPAQFDGDGP
jgi:hypothetical protein